jgi:DNA-binding NtrC family response regulator
LRVLQERIVTPVGTYRGERVDVQVIAATNRNLSDEVRAGRFREDLYYRLNVVHIRTTPLRERAEDIPGLAAAILAQLATEGLPRCRLSAASERALMRFSWPGNVRQLRNVLEQAAIDAASPLLGPDLFERHLTDASECRAFTFAPVSAQDRPADVGVERSDDAAATVNAAEAGTWSSLACVERQHLVNTLEHTFYNRTAAARLLGITRQALLRKMERHNIHAPRKGDV